jgi:hypothetical protein
MTAPPERIATFYHGTTVRRAREIVTHHEFAPRQTFFALGERNRDLAIIFARRAVARHPGEGGPALVVVQIGEAAFESLRKLGLMRLEGFDPEDRVELQGRSQWVLEAGGVERFNRDLDEMDWTPLAPGVSG